ncbi:hypothetical protein SCO02_13210 [Staphylococcus ureilyticus]|uniref:Uncharacterized protein n=1 Tax=Staphylococcus ureilyticus TaxID=94138 RepID=A0AB34AHL3_STAUR|nr:hypothetical protein [Staphylococcus ureilyticus]GEQ02880.1 hypothetical protein SCO02_13210 [Staphylococcus ureilyticus]
MERFNVKHYYFIRLMRLKKYSQSGKREINQNGSFDFNSRFLFSHFYRAKEVIYWKPIELRHK